MVDVEVVVLLLVGVGACNSMSCESLCLKMELLLFLGMFAFPASMMEDAMAESELFVVVVAVLIFLGFTKEYML